MKNLYKRFVGVFVCWMILSPFQYFFGWMADFFYYLGGPRAVQQFFSDIEMLGIRAKNKTWEAVGGFGDWKFYDIVDSLESSLDSVEEHANENNEESSALSEKSVDVYESNVSSLN